METMDASSSIGRKIPVLFSENCQWRTEQHYSEFPERAQPDVARNNQMFETFLLGIIVPFNFIPGISGGERGMLPIPSKIAVSISVIDWNFWEKRPRALSR